MQLHEKFGAILEELSSHFVEREEVLRGLIIATLADANMLLLGPPGTAKSESVVSWIYHIQGARSFEWLLNKFSTPEEILGPYSVKLLGEEDRYSRITVNKLPEADIAFVDEIFKCNSGLLNTMLPILNERKFYNDGKPNKLNLLSVVGASNEIPDSEDGLEALYDRFLLKYMVRPIQEDSNFEAMLMNGEYKPEVIITFKEIEKSRESVKKVQINKGMAGILIKLRRSLQAHGIFPTDRTYNTCLKLLKAEAFLAGRDSVEEQDFDVLRHVLWSDPKDEKPVWTIILNQISPEKSRILSIYEEAKELADGALGENDARKRSEKGIEAATKLKDLKTQISEGIEKMRAQKKDIREVAEVENRVNDMLAKIFKECMKLNKPITT